ncbi:hypothetical protein JXI42_02170 [bacterium]|nr:hypothetical protein [bacterium]
MNSKILCLSVLITVIFIFLIMSCNVPEPGRYYNEEYEFSMIFPTDWETEMTEYYGQVIIDAVSPYENDDDMFAEYISVSAEKLLDKPTLYQYYTDVLANSREESPDLEVETEEDVMIGKEKAKYAVWHYTFEGYPLTILAYFLVEGKKGYFLSCTCETEKFPAYKGYFNNAAQSFRFE